MIDIKVFNDNLNLLEKLFPQEFSDRLIEKKLKIFNATELEWEENTKRFTNKKIRYLLICEAPPNNGDYFYSNFEKSLFNKVWQTFFQAQKCNNAEDAYQQIADIGFLLIDTIPYSMDYSKGRKRYTAEYKQLVKNCLDWWQVKLKVNFILNKETIIAYGFKINSNVIYEVTSGKLTFSNLTLPPVDTNFVADINERWQPSISKLESVFKQK
jgi:hypothetical protein